MVVSRFGVCWTISHEQYGRFRFGYLDARMLGIAGREIGVIWKIAERERACLLASKLVVFGVEVSVRGEHKFSIEALAV